MNLEEHHYSTGNVLSKKVWYFYFVKIGKGRLPEDRVKTVIRALEQRQMPWFYTFPKTNNFGYCEPQGIAVVHGVNVDKEGNLILKGKDSKGNHRADIHNYLRDRELWSDDKLNINIEKLRDAR